jgi:thiol-disulfide isomerase/thioredoxin
VKRARPAALVLVAALTISACSAGHNGVGTGTGKFRYVAATKKGSVIPAASRKRAGNVHGELIGGGPWRLSDHLGHVVLINFWASWCGPCVIESPMLNQVYQETKASGVDFVGMDVKDRRGAARAFIAHNHMSYPMVYDEPAKTALQLGIPTNGLPVTVVIDREGRVAAAYLGAVAYGDIGPAVTTLAAER